MADKVSVLIRSASSEETARGEVFFDGFFDPLEGLMRLTERPSPVQIAHDTHDRTLRAKGEAFGGYMFITLDSSGLGERLWETFARGGKATLHAQRKDNDFTLVVNSEEQYS